MRTARHERCVGKCSGENRGQRERWAIHAVGIGRRRQPRPTRCNILLALTSPSPCAGRRGVGCACCWRGTWAVACVPAPLVLPGRETWWRCEEDPCPCCAMAGSFSGGPGWCLPASDSWGERKEPSMPCIRPWHMHTLGGGHEPLLRLPHLAELPKRSPRRKPFFSSRGLRNATCPRLNRCPPQ